MSVEWEENVNEREANAYEYIEVFCSDCGQLFYKEQASFVDEKTAETTLNNHVLSCIGAVSLDKKEYVN